MFVPCPSCKAELSAALVGADGRCPYCGTKAVASAPEPERVSKPKDGFVFQDDTVPAPRAKSNIAKPDIPDPPAAELPPQFSSAFEQALPRGWGGLAMGARGILNGKPASIPGRARFRVERPRTISWWDQWAVRFADGGDGWLFDREGALALLRPWKIEEPIAFDSLREGQLLKFERGPPATVVDLGTAVVKGAEGSADPFEKGMRIRYATLAGDAWRYHFTWSDSGQMECLRGEPLDPKMLAAGFALRAPSGFKDSAATSLEWFTNLPPSMQILLISLAIPTIAGVGIVVVFDVLARFFR